jgi:crossover junction endodeoxyribonuclease RuvC
LAYIRARVQAQLATAPDPLQGGAIEGCSYGSTHREFALGEVSGLLRADLYDRGVDLLVVPPTMLKKFATGRGHATKTQVMTAVETLWGAKDLDDNSADAVVLAQIARAFRQGVYHHRCQAEVIRALRPAPPLRLSQKQPFNI